jgi:hypothetical protein
MPALSATATDVAAHQLDYFVSGTVSGGPHRGEPAAHQHRFGIGSATGAA